VTCAGLLSGHEIITTKLTYTRDISPILKRHCLSCHAAGSAIPLTSYEEVRPWAVAIKKQVLARSMPPWGAVKGFRDLAGEEVLAEGEVQTIAAWVVGGSPRGDLSLLDTSAAEALPPPSDRLVETLAVTTRTVLRRSLRIAAIKPHPKERVDSVRILARLPNGRIEPLLWLYNYDPGWNRVYRFRESITLPRGTVIEASSPLRYSLAAPAKAP
jgi:hypothetical protein